ncbi:MAG: protein kinase, partial [Acidobacteriota bacterium]
RILGAGGMGLVFDAFDPELERQVALKMIRGATAQIEARFQREARAQARIDHENVCQVYEVGSIEGRPYIAMQFLEGQTLARAAADLTLRQKVQVMAAACEGLHAAHRGGLIHRDVKPANVMVEATPEGGLSVHVMDFGIARELAGPALTQTGMALGTPHYMAPEQVNTAIGDLDPRTDVYALGATLYKLLTGKTPFADHPDAMVVHLVVHEKPPSPRRLVPDLPRDLEAIVLRCLEKEPARRYPSARALYEDLRRYLDRQPIAARQASRLYRLYHGARQHRTALTIATGLTLAVVAALGSTIAERLRGRAIADAAQRFGREVESLTWIQRAAHQLPLHDVRAEHDLLRQRMRDIQQRMAVLGPAGEGPGLYALGRGHLALGEIEAAQARLQTAWDVGYRELGVAEALGQTLAARYEAALAQARRIANAAAREARQQQIQERYREPALEFLRRGRDADLEAPELIEARIALLEERWSEAAALARRAAERLPWRYEGLLIAGQTAIERARGAEARGAYDEAEAEYLQAQDAYRRASQIGASDPETWLALCRLEQGRALFEQDRRGRDAGPRYTAAIGACEKSLVAQPDHPEALGELAMLFAQRADGLLLRGKDPQPYLERAAAASLRAITAAPRAIGGWRALGLAKLVEGMQLANQGEEAAPAFDEAIASLDRVLELDAEFAHAHHLLSIVLMERARESDRRQEDPAPWFERASTGSERAIELAPSLLNAYLVSSVILARRAELAWARSEDPLPLQARAVVVLRQALEIDPELGFAYVNLGSILHRAAQSTAQLGDDPVPLLDESVATLHAALERVPDDAFAYFNLGHALVTRAKWQVSRGEAPGEWLEKAREAFSQGIQRAPGRSGPWASRGETWFFEALWIEEQDGDPSAALERAARGARESREVSANDPEHLILDVRIAAMRLRQAAADRPTGVDLARLRSELRSARATRKEAIEVELALTELDLEQAWADLAAGRPPDDPAGARSAVDTLIERQPRLAHALGLRAGWLRLEAAAGTDDAASLRREARGLLERALELDPLARLELSPVLLRANDAS